MSQPEGEKMKGANFNGQESRLSAMGGKCYVHGRKIMIKSNVRQENVQVWMRYGKCGMPGWINTDALLGKGWDWLL